MAEALGRALMALKNSSSYENDDLSTAFRHCATEASSTTILDNCEAPEKVIKHLLEISLEGRADDDTIAPDLKRARLALRTLVNFCNRSTKFKSAVSDDAIPLTRCILRISELQLEICAFLVAVVTDLHKKALLHKDYPALLSDLALLWHIMDDNSWITAFFLSIFETDFAFLSLAFRELPIEAFSSILEIAETILDSSETGEELKVHPNNVLYCVDFIERLLYDLGENAIKDTSHVPQLLISAIDIIGNCALRSKDYSTELLSKPRAIAPIVDVLETVLEAQTVVETLEAEDNPRVKYPDRPELQVACRVPRLQEDERLVALSKILVHLHEKRGKLKCAAVRTIGNLCCDSLPNQQAAGQRGAVIAVLRCTKKRPDDNPFIMQWAISALRHMVISCPENQDIVVSIDQQPTGILDRDRLLKELGVEVIKDEVTGKCTVKRVHR